jgi:hypothetical protein
MLLKKADRKGVNTVESDQGERLRGRSESERARESGYENREQKRRERRRGEKQSPYISAGD